MKLVDVESLPPRCAAIVAAIVDGADRIEAMHTGSVVFDCTPEQVAFSMTTKFKTARLVSHLHRAK